MQRLKFHIAGDSSNRVLNPRRQNILTNDPSLTAWGWAVLTPSGKILNAGAIKTQPMDKKLRIRKGDDRVRRVNEINNQLLRIIADNNVKLILSELPHGSQSATAALMIGITTGIMQTIGDCIGVAVEWYSEADAKQAITGKRSVSKEEMIKTIGGLYADAPFTGTKWKDEAIADALAIHHLAVQVSPALKIIQSIL